MLMARVAQTKTVHRRAPVPPAAKEYSCAIVSGQRLFLDLLGDMLRLRRGLRVTCFDLHGGRVHADGDGSTPFAILIIDFTSLDDDGRSAAAISNRHPEALVIAVAATASGFAAPAAVAGRVRAVMGKDEPFAAFLARLEEACGGRMPAADRRKAEPRRHAPLTAREAEIFALIADGLTTGEIAARLSRSFYTIQTHRKRIAEKLGRLGSPLTRRAAALQQGRTSSG